jgi:uncharacterized integral membrane protein
VSASEDEIVSKGSKESSPCRAQGPTRISWIWATLFVAVLLGIALVDFLAENTRSVRIEFFSAAGRVPIVVALLVGALAGAALVLVVGLARIGQLQRGRRRDNSGGNRADSQQTRIVRREGVSGENSELHPGEPAEYSD